MSKRPPFDDTTSCHERLLADIWKPYANPYHRVMRDAIYGPTPADYKGADIDPREHIHRNDLFKVYEGVRFANYLGSVLNVELTVNWQQGGFVKPAAVDAAFRSFTDRFKKFSQHRKSGGFFWAVFENSENIGLHSHMSLAVPNKYRNDFRSWLAHGLQSATGTGFPVSDYSTRIHDDNHVLGQWKWFRYSFKALDPTLSPVERQEHDEEVTLNSLAGVPYVPGGIVPFKRVRLCRALGHEAQRRADYQMPPTMGALSDDERYGDAEYRRGIQDRARAARRDDLGVMEVVPVA